jgi:hypothetical protein
VEVTPEVYCRELEAYLCRKNDGHLVRIVGPAFEQVCGWAARGVPLRIAQRGIDRYFERYYAKGPRRRPVRIEFCEADVLDVFDEWRRAVGVPVVPTGGRDLGLGARDAGPGTRDSGSGARDSEVGESGRVTADSHGDDAADEPERRHPSLPVHLDRAIARLTALRAGEDRRLDGLLDDIVRELDGARGTARRLRGPARDAFVERLVALDRMLLDAARAQCDRPALQRLTAEADAELAPFRARMAPDAYERARALCVDRGIRELRRLPVLSFD